jgi:hypothetical protein
MSFRQQLVSLFDNTAVVLGLAGIGLLFVCCGGNGVWQQSKPKTGPPAMTVQKLEATEALHKLPNDGLLELREGHLFWDGAKERITFQKLLGRKVKSSERTKAVYVPLLSKAAFARWRAHLANGEPVSSLPYDKCRVIVELSDWEMEAQFAAEAAALRDGQPPVDEIEKPRSFYGSVRRLADEDKDFVEVMAKGPFGYDANWTLVLRPQENRDDRDINRILGVCICVVGLASLMPLVVWAFRRWRKPTAEKPSVPAPLAETSTPENPKQNLG